MDRKNFFKKTCQAGLCACTGLAVFSQDSILADNVPAKADDWRIGFMQYRFAKLVDVINATIDEKTRNNLYEQMGKSCSQEGEKEREKFKGKIDDYLTSIKSQWVDKVVYDKEKGEIKITDKKRDSCFCPFVSNKMISKEFCNCSKGWQKQTYEYLLGKPVEVTIDTSILRGSDRCSFTIKILG